MQQNYRMTKMNVRMLYIKKSQERKDRLHNFTLVISIGLAKISVFSLLYALPLKDCLFLKEQLMPHILSVCSHDQ